MLAAWTAAQRFKVSLRDIDMAAALRLAASHGTYAYDAYMLQCALEHRGTLVTLDRRMIAVGKLIGLGISELPK